MANPKSYDELQHENTELRARLAEAEETLNAIQLGQVDALVVSTNEGNQIFTLQSADHVYRLLVETMQDGAVTVSTDGTSLYCNQRFADIVGNTIERIVSRPFDQYIVSAEREKFQTFLETVLLDGSGHEEFQCQNQSDHVVPVYVSANLLQLDQTQVICLIVTDLTEKSRLDEELRRSEARYRSVVTAMSEGVILMDTETRIQACNPSAEQILSLTADQMAGRTTFDPQWQAIHEDGSPFPGDTHPVAVTLRTGEPVSNVAMGVHKPDETISWILINSQPIFDKDSEKPAAVVASFTDITERKLTEENLRASEARYRTLVEQAADGIVVANSNGRFSDVNSAGCRMLGYTRAEILEKTLFDVTRIEPDQPLRVDELQQGRVLLIERELIRKDSTVFPAEISSKQTPDGNMQFIVRDITDRKRAEARIRNLAKFPSENPQPVLRVSNDGIVLYANIAGQSLLANLNSGVGHRAPSAWHPLIAEALATRSSTNIDFQQGDRTWSLLAVPLSDESYLNIYGTDITDRKRSEEALRQSEAALNQAQRVAGVGSWSWHIQDNRLEWSDEMYRIFDIDKESFTGNLSDVIGRAIHPDDRPIVEQSNQSVIENKTPIPVEYRIVRSDGSVRVVWAEAGEMILDTEGNPAILTGIVQDITERKEKEERLRSLYRTLALLSDVNQTIVRVRDLSQLFETVCRIAVEVGNFSIAWIGLIDPETQKLNPIASAGIDVDKLETLGTSLVDESQENDPLERVVHTGKPVIINDIENDPQHIPWREDVLKLDGRAVALMPLIQTEEVRGIFCLYSSIVGLFDDDELKLLDEMALDISFAMTVAEQEAQRQRAERELKQHVQIIEGMKDFLQTTLDAFPANTVVLEPDGTIINVNASWIEFARENGARSPVHYLGTNYLTVCDMAKGQDSNEASSVAYGIRAVISGSLDEFFLEYPCHSSTEQRWFILHVTPFPEPAPRRVVVSHINITQRKQAEEELQHLNDVLEQRVIERTAQLQSEKERVEAILNNSGDAIVLVDHDLLIQHSNAVFNHMFGYVRDEYSGKSLVMLINNGEPILTQILQSLTEQQPLNIEIEAQHKDGTVLDVEMSIGVIEENGYVCSFHDISARKQVEQSLRSAIEKEKELNELKTRFVSMASHEFRTPLATIHATTETLSTYRNKLNENQVEQKLSNIQTQVVYLKDIMDDVLKLARLQARQSEFNPRPIDLDLLCREVVGEFNSHPDSTHEIKYSSEQSLPVAQLDRKLIRQLVSNLLSNAIKYSPENKTVTVTLDSTDDMFVIIIQDNGVGISQDDLHHVFEPFHRGTNVETIQGTGLGLVIVKESVDLHGGTITVDSQLGEGTTVTVHIPINHQRGE